MMRYNRKLTQKEEEKKDGLSKHLKRKGKALDNAVEQFNDEIARLWESVETAIEEYNKALEKSKSFADEMVCKREEVYEKSSPRWRESPEADTFTAWLREWQNYLNTIEDVPLDCPEHDTSATVASINKAFDALPHEIEDPNPTEEVLIFKGRRVVGTTRRRV
ncbi:MAG: hypothetical protein DCF22_22805 [Leptolyngbya sp.]|nr:MAG: hypothetical protein DCF22_22805 [Leptolyngbya sp.]